MGVLSRAMTNFEQQIYGGIIVVVIGGLLTAGFKSVMKGYQCLKTGQDEISKTNNAIAVTLKGIEGRFITVDQWMTMHHDANNSAFAVVDRRIDELRDMVPPQ